MTVHALVILSGMLALERLVAGRNGLQVVLELVAPGYYCLFALACAASLHRARAVLLLLIVGVVLGCTPLDLAPLVRLLVPVGIGTVAGAGARAIIQE